MFTHFFIIDFKLFHCKICLCYKVLDFVLSLCEQKNFLNLHAYHILYSILRAFKLFFIIEQHCSFIPADGMKTHEHSKMLVLLP